MRNKKISKLVDPSFRLYFLVGFLFAAVTVRVSIPLAICEAAAMAFLWWYFRHTAQKRREGIRQYIDDVTDDMTTADMASMLSAPFAMMVFRPDTQEILWSNDSFMQLTGVREDIFDNRIDDILPDFPTHWLLEGKSECPETVVMGGRHFRVFGNLSHPSSRRGRQSLLATTYWTDVTEQDSLREENESRRPIVSVIVIDNYEELMKAGSEASRSAVLAAIDEKISTWLKDSHSLLRKFDRNRYVLVTTEQEYQKLLEGKFSVLDAVRSVVTEDGVAATLSIGVGKDVDDYETLYQNAMLSIEMALSRGGDQVVVRNRLDFEFYGGKAKSPEKRTKVKSRVMANALGELISDAGQIFVMGHAHADMDVVGAAAGICCIARKRGKKAQIVIDMEDNVAKPLLSKLAALPEYKDAFISGNDAFISAQPGALRQRTHHRGDQQCRQHRGVLAAGTRLAELEEGGHGDKEEQQAGHNDGQHAALALAHGVGALQGEAALEELHADEDTGGEARQTHHRVQIAAAHAEHHTEGAAQKRQRTDHHERAQHEAGGGRGAGLGAELLRRHGHDERAQHQPDDLRADVLHLRRAVHTHGSGDVTQEAGDTEAHVGGVAQLRQHHGSQTHHRAGDDHDPTYSFHRG